MNAGRLLVITYHFGPDGAVGGLRWAGITKYLERMGWQVVVLTGAAPGGNGARCDGPAVEYCPRLWTSFDGVQLLRRLARQEPLPNGSGRLPAARRPGALRRLRGELTSLLAFPDDGRGWVCRAMLRARRVMREFQPHVVVSSGPPHSAHLVAGLATVGSGARWFVDLRDPWAGPLTVAWTSDSRAGTQVFRALTPRLEGLVFRAAQGLITSTHELGAALVARYPGVPVTHIPNGVDRESLPQRARLPQYPGLGVVHAGTLYIGRDLGPVVRALRIFLERHPEAAQAGSRLRVAGKAEPGYAEAFHGVVAAAGMEPHVEVLGRLPRAEALDVISRSRLAVVLAQEQELQIPAKLYECVALGIPTLVIAPPDSAAGVEGERIGAMVRDGADVHGIASVLEQVWRDGSPKRPPSPVPITYDAIAPLVDQLLRASLQPSSFRLPAELTAPS